MRKTRQTDALSAENVATWSGTIYLVPHKKLSEKYGLTVHLCYECHRDNKLGVHGDAELMRRLHEVGQAAFDKKYGHGEFEKIFKKNYLNREETER